MATVTITCDFCLKKFKAPKCVAKRKKYCSKLCYHSAPNKRQVSATQRKCRFCGQVKDMEAFDFHYSQRRSGLVKYYSTDCKNCRAEGARRMRYGVTLADMVDKQGTEMCPLCLKNKATDLDHDHATGKPRGGLCSPCNRVLSYLENADWLRRATEYLKQGLEGDPDAI